MSFRNISKKLIFSGLMIFPTVTIASSLTSCGVKYLKSKEASVNYRGEDGNFVVKATFSNQISKAEERSDLHATGGHVSFNRYEAEFCLSLEHGYNRKPNEIQNRKANFILTFFNQQMIEVEVSCKVNTETELHHEERQWTSWDEYWYTNVKILDWELKQI